jgi:hypothetical protein
MEKFLPFKALKVNGTALEEDVSLNEAQNAHCTNGSDFLIHWKRAYV